MIYLASNSPRRKELLQKLKIAFRVVPSGYRERPLKIRAGAPSKVAMAHALGKARCAVVPRKTGVILGADTLIYFRGRIHGKPRSLRHAVRMLNLFSGKSHDVYTGLALIDLETGRQTLAWDKTRVAFRRLDTKTIGGYLARVNPFDKAGAYAIQDSDDLVKSIRGSYSNVMGLPVELLKRKLKKFYERHI